MFPGQAQLLEDFPLQHRFMSQGGGGGLECYTGLKAAAAAAAPSRVCPNGAIWHESPALKSVESTVTLGCLRCVVRRLGKEGGWTPPEGSMQNRNTWPAHPISPCWLGCRNDLQEAKPTSHRSRPRGQRKRRRDAKSHLHAPFPASWERRLFTCRLQVALAGPVNTTGRPVGLAQPRHLSWGTAGHCYGPAKACFLPDSL